MCGDMACYTPVPYYRTRVSCGLPNEFGDVPAEEILVPSILLSNLKVYVVDAEGDSMEGARIFPDFGNRQLISDILTFAY